MPMMEVTEYEQMMLLGWRGMAQAKQEETLEVVEETRHAQRMQTLFTQAQLAEKWGCSDVTTRKILSKSSVEPIGKRGRELEYNIEEAEEAKRAYYGEALYQRKLNQKIRAM
ncbi:TPA: MarR family transcriptional regulator [Enterococcus faecalis]